MGIIVSGKKYGSIKASEREKDKVDLSDVIRNVDIPYTMKTRFGFYKAGSSQRKGAGETFPVGVPTMTFGSTQMSMGSAITTAPIFYDIRYFTPDKYYFPRNEFELNDVWRLVYRRDPVVGAAIDLYADFAWSEFELVGVEDPVIRETYEEMCDSVGLLGKLPDMSREFLITGKVIPHLIFDSVRGIWKYLMIHNPNWIKVIFVPIAGEEPIIYLKLPEDFKRLFTSTDPLVQQRIIERIPGPLKTLILSAGQIPLDNLNVSYIARKVLASDFLGTSLLERIYRMLMYEDFLMNAALAVAQRQAVPLRLFKLGDHETGWFPTKEDEEALAEMLAIAEADPLAALIFHSGIEVDYVGVSERFWNISREWDFIENLKLIGLGVSKSFLLGESSFASAVAGLQTFVQKVAGIRLKFEAEWLYPKFFKPIAVINEFYVSTEAELSHRVRIRGDRELIIPKIKWRRSLEPTQDTSLLSVWRELHDKGIISDRTYAAGAGVSLDIERKNIREELEHKVELEKFKGDLGIEEEGAKGRGVLGSKPLRSSKFAGNGVGYHVPSKYIHSQIWTKDGYYKGIHFSEIEPVIAFARGDPPPEFMDLKGLTEVYQVLANKGWDGIKLKICNEVLIHEGLIPSINNILTELEKSTNKPDFLSGIIENKKIGGKNV